MLEESYREAKNVRHSIVFKQVPVWLLAVCFAMIVIVARSDGESSGGAGLLGKVYQAEELLKGEALLGAKVEKDAEKAVVLLNEVVRDTEGMVSNQAVRADALNLLAYCHLDGLGMKRDIAKAAELFEASGKIGKCKASSDAAMCYALGLGVRKDEKKAFELIKKAVADGASAREGSPDHFEISMFDIAGTGGHNFTLAFEAKNNLALCFLKGFGCEADRSKAESILCVDKMQFGSAEEGLLAAYCLQKRGDAASLKKAENLLVEGVVPLVRVNTGKVNRFWGNSEWIKRFVVPCEDILSEMESLGVGAMMQLCVRKYAGDHMARDIDGSIAILKRVYGKDRDRALDLMDHLCAMCEDGHPEDKVRLLNVFREIANTPDYMVAYWLGLGMCNGSACFDVNMKEGQKYLLLAADKGNIAAAQYDLGMRLTQGTFGEPDVAKGVDWLAKAVDNGYVNACLNLGLIYVKGWGVEKNVEKGVSYVRRGADAGDAMAQLTLGTYYQYGHNGVKIDTREGFKWVNAAYTNGYNHALYHMSRAYAYGIGVETNVFKAIDFALRAIDAGDERVKDFIGEIMPIYEVPKSKNGEDVDKLRYDAQTGDARSQYLLARSYFYGEGIEKDVQASLLWAKKAAEQNYADAANLISVYHFKKALEDGDYAESNRWGFKAIQLGSLKAMLNYTKRYQYGKGVDVDEKMAARLARVAAVCGLPEAQYQYGLYLYGGFGVKRDRKKGLEWIESAAKLGCKEALDLLEEIKKE